MNKTNQMNQTDETDQIDQTDRLVSDTQRFYGTTMVSPDFKIKFPIPPFPATKSLYGTGIRS